MICGWKYRDMLNDLSVTLFACALSRGAENDITTLSWVCRHLWILFGYYYVSPVNPAVFLVIPSSSMLRVHHLRFDVTFRETNIGASLTPMLCTGKSAPTQQGRFI
jgi:hypothetical protein